MITRTWSSTRLGFGYSGGGGRESVVSLCASLANFLSFLTQGEDVELA